MTNEEKMKILKNLLEKITDLINEILMKNPELTFSLATLMGSIACEMVVKCFGKTQEGQDKLNFVMQQAWKSIKILD